jgi:general stress protein 26
MSEATELTGAEGMKKLGDLIADIRFAMLATTAQDGTIDSRPMATQKTEFQGSVWSYRA